MNKKSRVLEYFMITVFGWGLYLVWLIPFQLYIVGLNLQQFITWLSLGTGAEMIFTYPIAKTLAKYIPKITLYCEEISNEI